MTVCFGDGDDDAGVLFHLCFPFLFSFFIGVDGVKKDVGNASSE